MPVTEFDIGVLAKTETAFNADELIALCQRIVASGKLGRSKNYSAILEYLVQCSIAGKSPKEIEIATHVLGRPEDFDVATDSTVRVYMHQLRKKLDSYYLSHEQDASHRIVIPKGQYTIAALPLVEKTGSATLAESGSLGRSGLNSGLLVVLIALLLSNLLYMVSRDSQYRSGNALVIAENPIWAPLLDDELPIMLVMGDYYIFGELNANGNIMRMVREFNVNSKSDLEDLQFSEIERASQYLDLDLSYMPEGSAFALAKIVPVLEESGKTVTITMMSDLTTSDIRSNHIVYIGYISALEKLTKMAFAGSGLSIGRSYDELLNVATDEYYTSDAGLPENGEPFRDYGMFSTFPAGSNSHVVVISGMRDAGLMHTAQALSDGNTLEDMIAALDGGPANSFEALFEVFGVDRMNFDANLIYTKPLDATLIWGGLPAQFNTR